MKLRYRLALMVLCAVLGLLLIAGFSLSALRSNMLENKRSEIFTVLNLAAQQTAYFQDQEQRGTLSREVAQAKGLEVAAIVEVREAPQGDPALLAKVAAAGMMVLPLASMKRVPSGKVIAAIEPSLTEVMRSPSITITPFAITPASSVASPARIVRIRAPWMTVVPEGLAFCTVT